MWNTKNYYSLDYREELGAGDWFIIEDKLYFIRFERIKLTFLIIILYLNLLLKRQMFPRCFGQKLMTLYSADVFQIFIMSLTINFECKTLIFSFLNKCI